MRSYKILCIVGVLTVFPLILFYQTYNPTEISHTASTEASTTTHHVYQKYHEKEGKATLFADFEKDVKSDTAHRYATCQHFHLITMFFSVHAVPKYSNFGNKSLDARDKEYIDVLQSNLNHPCIEKIHLFYINDVDIKRVETANLTNHHKLQPVKRDRLLHMADFFIYASRNVLNKPVIGLNGDIVIGEGFHLIDFNKMIEEKEMYSLTRYEGNLNCSIRRHMCIDNYFGSHDTHIFALGEPLNETLIMEKLDYPTNMNQAENGMIYTMRHLLGYTVLNPCKTLKTYHHHCSAVHGGGEDTYTIYNLGWNRVETHMGEAKPVELAVKR